MEDYILRMNHITKLFPGVKALDDVTFDVRRGEIHALCGENGAGKSTLMKVLSGEHTDYTGELILEGKPVEFDGVKESEAAGIAIIHQELGLIQTLNVCENIFLGNELTQNGFINWDVEYKRAKELLDELNLKVNPMTRVGNLGIGQQQLVEIAKALNKNCKILILDEPTAPLPEDDSENLLNLVRGLRDKGMSIVFISHKLGEVLSIADTITILRDGQTVDTKPASEYTQDTLISGMVGRELTTMFEPRDNPIGKVKLQVTDWSVFDGINHKWIVQDINLKVHEGEVVGLAGMIGAGRTELGMSIFGSFEGAITGKLEYLGKERPTFKNAYEAINAGVFYSSEDRKRFGLILSSDIAYNASLSSLDKFLTGKLFINKNKEYSKVKEISARLRIKTPSILQRAGNLSGGNQQKVCLAKALMTEPQVLILDEATRGIDVGAKAEIYKLINQMAGQGIAVIMISSELPEILGMSDRIYVMREGKISAEFDNKARDVTQEDVALAATGGVTV
ncbi:MAG: ATP-binding cassette domain-containing protein [Planctomycetes bacterium]|nr:ATP-binding cassette domain-containing protein [Planctomycetota bacterium]